MHSPAVVKVGTVCTKDLWHIVNNLTPDEHHHHTPFTSCLHTTAATSARDRHGHFNAFSRIVPTIALDADHAIHDIHPADHFSECRILAIQK